MDHERAAHGRLAKSSFLASMSHELRTPLNAILGYAQLLKWEQGLTEKQRTGLNTIEQSGQHLLALIDEVLDLSRIEAGKLELRPAPLELAPFVRAIADIIRVRLELKGLQFDCETSDLPAVVLADEKQLRQILLNLLGNAAKFTDRGQVKLRLTAQPDRGAGVATVRFAVEDTGIGIKPEQLKGLFHPFEQLADPSRRRGGSGLGLAISRQLVRLMGSDIEVASEPGQGSRFWFDLRLPIAQPAPTQQRPRLFTGYEGPRKKILIVDDIIENRQVLAGLLRPLDFVLFEAEDGRQGLERALALNPDAVLMDNVMPVMDGLEATRQMRQVAALREVPIIAISASAGRKDEEAAYAAGANAFLSKPFRTDDLLALLERHLGVRFVER
jgi:CheY-like chemotaxis protein